MGKEYSNVVIARSFVKGQPNWSGKEFSSNPAKAYNSFNDLVQALDSYWFSSAKNEISEADQRSIMIIHLSEKEKVKQLAAGTIRW